MLDRTPPMAGNAPGTPPAIRLGRPLTWGLAKRLTNYGELPGLSALAGPSVAGGTQTLQPYNASLGKS